MRHSYYASNGHIPPSARVNSAVQGEASRSTPTEIHTQREDAARHDTHDRNLTVELEAILKAQRAISREVEAGGLIETLLMIAVELVGAQRGLVFLARGQEHEIEAEATTLGGSVRVVLLPALTTSPPFPRGQSFHHSDCGQSNRRRAFDSTILA
jgi:hypothetical protein